MPTARPTPRPASPPTAENTPQGSSACAPVLAFDTAGPRCAAALLLAGRAPITRVDEMARGQAEHLMGMLGQMLADQGLDWRDLGAIGVGTGPGNFTGIRIAVAAARGLALALDIPAIGISTFEAAAETAPRPVRVALPAPREQAYLQQLTADGPQPPELVPMARLDALATRSTPLIRAGDIAPDRLIAATARLAAARAGQPAPRPAPLYVRPADAAPARDAPPVILP